eukprot:m.570514 g.570514  ORF g.570514 m.570514 type:complete len:185 (-) comp57852_c0_seq26:39-593(-)
MYGQGATSSPSAPATASSEGIQQAPARPSKPRGLSKAAWNPLMYDVGASAGPASYSACSYTEPVGKLPHAASSTAVQATTEGEISGRAREDATVGQGDQAKAAVVKPGRVSSICWPSSKTEETQPRPPPSDVACRTQISFLISLLHKYRVKVCIPPIRPSFRGFVQAAVFGLGVHFVDVVFIGE